MPINKIPSTWDPCNWSKNQKFVELESVFRTPLTIHVASRRQPPAPHRWAHTAEIYHDIYIYIYIKIIYVHIEWTVHTVNDVSHCSLLLPLFSSIAVAPRQEPLCGRHGLNDVVLTPSRPLVTANDVGHWDQKHPKVLIVGKKNAKNLIAMYSGPTQFKKIAKNMKKRRNCCYLQCFCAVRSRNHCKYHGFWGSGGQKHCNLQCFLTNVKKHWYLRCFHSHRNIKQRNLRGFWKLWS